MVSLFERLQLPSLLLPALVLWTLLGLAGCALAGLRGERSRLLRGARALGLVWLVYLAVLAGVSLSSPARVYRPGEAQCSASRLCVSIDRVEEVEGFHVRGQERERLLRVAIRLTNGAGGRAARDEGLQAYLVDAQERRWLPVPGLSGVRLDAEVPAGAAVVSQPVFRVAADATALRLVLFHRGWTAARLRVGDAESWLHRPSQLVLPPGQPAAGKEL